MLGRVEVGFGAGQHGVDESGPGTRRAPVAVAAWGQLGYTAFHYKERCWKGPHCPLARTSTKTKDRTSPSAMLISVSIFNKKMGSLYP